MLRTVYVSILASRSRVLYIGVTNDIARRLAEHRSKTLPGFTDRYNVSRLVYLETYPDPVSAIAREKHLKCWRRDKKIRLIEAKNPTWRDLTAEIFDGGDASSTSSAR